MTAKKSVKQPSGREAQWMEEQKLTHLNDMKKTERPKEVMHIRRKC